MGKPDKKLKKLEKKGPRKIVVLLIDPNRHIMTSVENGIKDYLKTRAKQYGYDEDKAELLYEKDAVTGFSTFNTKKPELVIVEANLDLEDRTKLNGFDVVRKIKKTPDFKGTIICCGNGDYTEQAVGAGADRFVQKGALWLFKTLRDYPNSFLKQDID